MYKRKDFCTIIIVAVNVAVFFLLSFQGMTENAEFMLEHGAMYVPYFFERQEYYRIISSLFLHFGFPHLMNNMVLLFLLGTVLETENGKLKFLVIYFASGMAGNALSIFFELKTRSYAVSAGASGAIFGVIGALLYIAIRNKGRVGNLSGKGLAFIVFCSLYLGFTSSGVDNTAHIGGLLAGIILAAVLYRRKRNPDGEDTSAFIGR